MGWLEKVCDNDPVLKTVITTDSPVECEANVWHWGKVCLTNKLSIGVQDVKVYLDADDKEMFWDIVLWKEVLDFGCIGANGTAWKAIWWKLVPKKPNSPKESFEPQIAAMPEYRVDYRSNPELSCTIVIDVQAQFKLPWKP